jgi:hypothetical protein
MKLAVRAALLLAVLQVVLGCRKAEPTNPSAPPDDKGTNPGTQRMPELSVTSEALCKEYELDRKAAEAKYKDKWIEVEGPLATPPGFIFLSLKGFEPENDNKALGYGVLCDFSRYEPKLVDLTMGQTVKVRGNCFGDGGGARKLVTLKNCVLSEVGADPAIAVTSTELSRGYAADRKAADAKYRRKWLKVEGVVIETRPDDKAVVLRGSDEKTREPVPVVASCKGMDEDAVGRVKVGDSITIKGECYGQFGQEVRIYSARLME